MDKINSEQTLLDQIANRQSMIEAEQAAYKERLEPHQAALYILMEQYSRTCSPLKPGDHIEYAPSSSTPPGVVEILKANCREVPDRWEYQVRVLSVGEGREKQAVGKVLWININRSETPKPISQT